MACRAQAEKLGALDQHHIHRWQYSECFTRFRSTVSVQSSDGRHFFYRGCHFGHRRVDASPSGCTRVVFCTPAST